MWALGLLKGFVMQHFMKLIGGGLILIAVVSVYLYINHLQKENRILHQNNAKLELAYDTQQDTIYMMQVDIGKIKKSQKDLESKSEQYRNDIEELRLKFNKNGRDFGSIAKEKPGLVEGLVNKGTKKTFDCFEELSRNEEGESCE